VDDTEEARIIAEQAADRDTEYGEVVERTGEFLAEIDREIERNRATPRADFDAEAEDGDHLQQLERLPDQASTKFLGRAVITPEVEESEADLERFDRWLASIVARDYFAAAGRHDAEAAIQRCRDALAAFEAAAVVADTDTTSSPSQSRDDHPGLRVVGGE
jgi:hypothetical protein